ncbi:MAG: hypothetical protein AMXMBFR84_22400 [Candidatus Hydrogenedentota bacterium]
MTVIDVAMRHAVIDAYRVELQHRYTTRNVRRFVDRTAFDEAVLKALRTFFLNHIYPPAKEREKLDAACDHVAEILRTPKQVMPLLGTALKTLIALGTSLPAAASMTVTTLEALKETRRFESELVKLALRSSHAPIDLKERAVCRALVALLPKKEVIRFRTDVIKLFDSMNNVKLLRTGVRVMEQAMTTMRGRPDKFSDRDIQGFELGRTLLHASQQLYEMLKPGEASQIVAVIERIEIDWYEGVIAEAHNR